MIYHLITDDKFLDGARDLFEEVAPGKNRFFLLGSGGSSLRYIKTFVPERATAQQLSAMLNDVSDANAVVVHYMNEDARLALAGLSPAVPVAWFGWGGDYYHLIRRNEELLLPATRALLEQITPRRPGLSERLARLMLRVLRNPMKELLERRSQRRSATVAPGSIGERTVLSRVDYFIPIIREDAELLTARNAWFKPQVIEWNYPEMEKSFRMVDDGFEVSGEDVLLGNSATPQNNHLDALHLLKPHMRAPRRILCPLSYGDPLYRDAVIREGSELYGSQFRPLTDFMPIAEYLQSLRQCSIAVMPHLRQQALGNVIMMMYAGTRIALAPDNPLFSFLKRKGLPVWSLRQLDLLFEDTPKTSSREIEEIRSKLLDAFGHSINVERTSGLVSALLESASAPQRRRSSARIT